jgi:tRNA modification GTPase
MASTIAAIATPPGAGERGVVRVSGPLAFELARQTFTLAPLPDFTRRGLYAGRFRDARGTQPVLLVVMPAPRSFTREDVVEFHLPAAPPLLHAALARLLELGAVPARVGEFTRRAFEHGRIDLTRAEGILAMVAARTRGETSAAARLLFGGLEERVESARDALDELRALCEASLDFDENDTGHVPARELAERTAHVRDALESAVAFESARARVAGAPRIVLFGAPNAGKSSLFNALLRRDAALVSALAGTTRDVLAAPFDLAGQRLVLVDTAGFDEQARGVEAAAQALGRAERGAGDLCVWVVDATRAERADLEAERRSIPSGIPTLLAWNKLDLAAARALPDGGMLAAWELAGAVPVSARTGQGLDTLQAALAARLGTGGEGLGIERELFLRHQAGLECALAELTRGEAVLASGGALELFAEHLRSASQSLDELSGTTRPEDLLDRIFARFCLGK